MPYRVSPFHCTCLLFLALLVVACPAVAGLELVRDIETTGEPLDTCPPADGEIEEGPGPWWNCQTFLGSLPSQLTALGDRLVFIADDRVHGGEPWVSDGTADGTRLLADVCAGACSSTPRILGRVQGHVLFWAWEGEAGSGVWRTDGTPAGTSRVRTLCPRRTAEDEEEGTPFCGIFGTFWWGGGAKPESVRRGGKLYYAAFDRDGVHQLWVSDGTAAGTRPVTRRTAEGGKGLIEDLLGAGDGIYFMTDGAIWRAVAGTDGEGSGDTLERVFELPPVISSLSYLVPFGNGVIWIGGPEEGPLSLWRVEAGRPAENLLPVAPDSSTLAPVGIDASGLYFVINPGSFEPVLQSLHTQVWRTDGTVSGTTKLWTVDGLRDILTGWEHAPGKGGGSPLWGGGFVVRGVGLETKTGAFSGDFLQSGLWRVDPQTRRFEFLGDSLGLTGRPVIEEVVHGRLLANGFYQTTRGGAYNHYVLWLSDGTREGTGALVTTRDPFDNPYDVLGSAEVELVGDTLFVSLDTLDEGRQLYRMSVRELFDRSAPLLDGRFRAWVRFLDHRNTTQEDWAAALPPTNRETSRFWFFRPDNPEVVVKVLDGKGVNGNFWVFHGGTTDLAYEVVVRDQQTWETRTYERSAGTLCGDFDTAAFTAAATAPATSPTAPAASANPAVCGDDVLCLGNDDRFRVRVRYRNQYADGAEGVGRAVLDSDRAGWFWFFGPDKLEVMVKVLDGRPVNGHHWVLWGGLTTVEYDLEVTDTVSGVTRTYHHAPGDLCGGADTAAF